MPDLQLDIENMSLDRLRELNKDASAAEREQVRQDCARLANAIASLPGSVRTVEPYTPLIGLWRWLDFRAVLIPFLIHVRRRGYSDALEISLRDFEAAVAAITPRQDTPQDGELPPQFHMTAAGPGWRPEVRVAMRALRIPDASLDAFEVPPGLSAIHFLETELHAYNA